MQDKPPAWLRRLSVRLIPNPIPTYRWCVRVADLLDPLDADASFPVLLGQIPYNSDWMCCGHGGDTAVEVIGLALKRIHRDYIDQLDFDPPVGERIRLAASYATAVRTLSVLYAGAVKSLQAEQATPTPATPAPDPAPEPLPLHLSSQAPILMSPILAPRTDAPAPQPLALGEIRVVKQGTTRGRIVRGTCRDCGSRVECDRYTALTMEGDRAGEPSSLYVFCEQCKREGRGQQYIWLKGNKRDIDVGDH